MYGDFDAWDIMAPEMKEVVRRNYNIYCIYLSSKREQDYKRRSTRRERRAERRAERERKRAEKKSRMKWKIPSSEAYLDTPRRRAKYDRDCYTDIDIADEIYNY